MTITSFIDTIVLGASLSSTATQEKTKKRLKGYGKILKEHKPKIDGFTSSILCSIGDCHSDIGFYEIENQAQYIDKLVIHELSELSPNILEHIFSKHPECSWFRQYVGSNAFVHDIPFFQKEQSDFDFIKRRISKAYKEEILTMNIIYNANFVGGNVYHPKCHLGKIEDIVTNFQTFDDFHTFVHQNLDFLPIFDSNGRITDQAADCMNYVLATSAIYFCGGDITQSVELGGQQVPLSQIHGFHSFVDQLQLSNIPVKHKKLIDLANHVVQYYVERLQTEYTNQVVAYESITQPQGSQGILQCYRTDTNTMVTRNFISNIDSFISQVTGFRDTRFEWERIKYSFDKPRCMSFLTGFVLNHG